MPCECGHEHLVESLSLHDEINFETTSVLNAANPNDLNEILKPECQKELTTKILSSDVDEEILITVRFKGLVKLHSVSIRSLGDDSSPSDLRLFKHELDLEEAAESTPDQHFECAQLPNTSEFVTNRAKFNNLKSITLHINTNYGSEVTKLCYVGFKGEFSKLSQAPLKFEYELIKTPHPDGQESSLEQTSFSKI